MRRPGGILGLAALALALARCGNDSPSAGPAVPGVPAGLTATAVSSSRIDLSWTDNATNEDGFRIERCGGASCTAFADVGSAAAGATAYQNSGLTAATSYTYRVRAYNAAGQSAPSTTASATTDPLMPPATPPAAPSELAATVVSSTRIDLTWTDNSTDEDGFAIERCSDAGCTEFAPAASVGANAISYQNSGLSGGTTYRYRVRALNGAGFSGYSNIVTATTDDAVPAAPTLTGGAASSSTAITIYWADNSANETGFTIERCTGAGCASFSQIATTGANVTAFQNTGLTASTSYTYRVRAYNAAGNSAYSDTAIIVTHATSVPPVAPSDLVATAVSGTRIDLSWMDRATNENGFLIERAAGGGAFSQIATVGANTISFHNTTGLTAGTTYAYRVRAYNGTGTSPYSNTATAATPAPTGALRVNSATTGTNLDPTGYVITVTPAGGLSRTTDLNINGFVTFSDLPAGSATAVLSDVASNCTVSGGTSRSVTIVAGPTQQITFTVTCAAPPAPQAQLRIVNNVSTALTLDEVVQVKIALTEAGTFTRDDLLSPDNLCWALPGDGILSGNARTFTLPAGVSDYWVFIGMGTWETDFVSGACPTTHPWFKRRFFFLAPSGALRWVWRTVHVTGHTSGVFEWTITGSDYGSLFINPAGSSSILFNVTAADPIP